MIAIDTAKQKIVDAAMELRNSGYDGEFIDPVCEPLFTALAEYELALKAEKSQNEFRQQLLDNVSEDIAREDMHFINLVNVLTQ